MRTTDQVFAKALLFLIERHLNLSHSPEQSEAIAIISDLADIESVAPQAEPQGGEGEYVVWKWEGDRWETLGVWSDKYSAETFARHVARLTRVTFVPAPPPPTETPGDAAK